MKNNYKEMTLEELVAEQSKLKQELFNITFQNSVGQLKDTSSIRTVKKNIARVKTVISEKTVGAKE